MVFTELVEFVEDEFGYEMVDRIIEEADLSSGGAYTQAGNYPFEELLAFVTALSNAVNVPVEALIEVYGRHLFRRIVGLYPPMVEGFDSPIEFIANVENFIHPEVLKLYPDADLPTFDVISKTERELVTDYTSGKPLASFAKGLMLGCGDYFNRPILVDYEIVQREPVIQARFVVRMD